jgi:hypothetical protein
MMVAHSSAAKGFRGSGGVETDSSASEELVSTKAAAAFLNAERQVSLGTCKLEDASHASTKEIQSMYSTAALSASAFPATSAIRWTKSEFPKSTVSMLRSTSGENSLPDILV